MNKQVKQAWILLMFAIVAIAIKLLFKLLPTPFEGHAEVVTQTLEEGIPAEPEVIPEPEPEEFAATVAVADNNSESEEERADDWPPAPLPPEPQPVAQPPPPPPVQYHFRKIRWGMSPDEVCAAEGMPPIRANEQRLEFITTTQGWPCLLNYYFMHGQLYRARLIFSDPTGMSIPPLSVAQAQQRYLYLRARLNQRYGQPIEKSLTIPRDTVALQRAAQNHEELAQQYDTAIADAEARLVKERAILERRFARWKRRNEMIARGLAPFERDVAEMKQWKQDALDRLTETRRGIEQSRSDDRQQPLIAGQIARWPAARDLHNIEMRLDYRQSPLRLELRYAAIQLLPPADFLDEL